MSQPITFRLPDNSFWSTPITPTTRVQDIVTYLSQSLRTPADKITIWDRDLLLCPEAKLQLRADARGLRGTILTVKVGAAPPEPTVSDGCDLATIDPREQEQIEQRIRQRQIDANRRLALARTRDYTIGRSVRCLVVKIRGKTLRMIVDTGASVSLLYTHDAQFCSVSYLIDTSDETQILISGVGDSLNQTVGVIHSLEVMIGDVKTQATFAVLDSPDAMGLLGIDWLRENNATIKVAEDVIEIGGTSIPLQDP